jgi:hypothetical protein
VIAQRIIREVQRLLREGRLSQRQIAIRTGISRGTVRLIAIGRRRDYADKPAEEEVPAGPPQRCSRCGGLVYGQCRLCDIRTRSTSRHGFRDDGDPLKLDLKSEHQARYEEMRLLRTPREPIDRR